MKGNDMQHKIEYPKMKYHPESGKDPVIVQSHEEEKLLGSEWVDSPAEYGHETSPGEFPDESILANKSKKHDKQKKHEIESHSEEKHSKKKSDDKHEGHSK